MDKVKVAIPSDDGRNISLHLGRSCCWIIYEIEDNKIKKRIIRENISCPHRSNVCPKMVLKQTKEFVKRIRDEVIRDILDCKIMIGRYMKQRAIDNLRSHNIKVILVDEKDADTAIEKYLIGELVEIQNSQFCMCCQTDCLKI